MKQNQLVGNFSQATREFGPPHRHGTFLVRAASAPLRVLQRGAAIACGRIAVATAALLAAGAAAATLTVTPLAWNVIGLDSNDPASGPRRFPVGARVCSDVATTGVNVNFELATANPYINVRPGSLTSIVVPALAAGACSDAYFEVEVAANAAAYGTTERYRITANDGTGLVSTPVPRELFVERLVSQARNEVSDVKVNGVSIPAGGTMSLMVGSVYDITLVGATATQGYNQLESFINFPNTVFQVLSVATTYSVGGANNRLYADACGWENNPASPNYRSCVVSDNKAGGSVNTVYTVRIIGGGGTNEALNTLIYDFSGSSYHYNADYAVGARIAQIVNASSLGFAKAFAPAATVAGGTSTLTFTISNPNAGAVTGLNFVDNLPSSPAQMVVATPLTVSTSGCGPGSVTAVAGGTSISFANGSVAANGSCTVSVRVSAPAAPTSGSYVNTSQPLFVGTTSTGNTATATLNLTTTPPPSLSCGLPLATWTMEPAAGATSPPLFTTRAADVASATATAGAGVTTAIETTLGNPPNAWAGYGWSTNATPGAGDEMIFAVTTTNYTNVVVRFDGRRSATGPQSLQLSYSTDGVNYTNYGGVLVVPETTFTTFNPVLPGPANAGGLTYFRLVAYNASNSGTNARLYVDNVRVEGCQTALHPSIAKAFAPASIPLVGGVSTLTFTLANPNATQLTGVRFTDSLPANVQVAAPPAATTTCGGSPTWAPVAGANLLAFGQATGATIPGSSSCTVSVNVTGTTSGAKFNVTDFVASTESGTNTGPTGSATATLTVEPALLPPVAVKSFAPDVIASGGRSMLTITITNPNTLHTLTGVAIIDAYPGAIANANPLVPPATNTCGGTLTAIAGEAGLSLTGASIPPGANCVVEVPVTASILGDHVNTTEPVVAAVVGSGNAASATLSVDPAAPALRLSKQVRIAAPPGTWLDSVVVAPGAALEYRFIVENVGNVPVTGVTVTDPLLSGAGVSLAACSWPLIPVASAVDDPTVTCSVGPLSPAAAGVNTNTATAQGTYAAAPVVSPTDQATYFGAVPGLSLTKLIGLSASGPWLPSLTVAAGTNLYYRFTIANNGNTTFTGVSITDPSPAIDESQCTYVDPLPPGGISVCTLGPVAAGGAGGSTTTNTATATGTDGGGAFTTPPSSASYTIQLISADVSLAKTLVPAGPFTIGQSIAYSLVVANAGPNVATSVQVTDTPSNLTITGVSGGGCAALPCTIASLASGASATINVTATINAAGAFDNAATATAVESDPVPGNNTDNTGNGGTAGSLTADLAITKTDGAATVTAGQNTTYTLVVTNNGPGVSSNVVVADTLPPQLTFVSLSSPAGWTCTTPAVGTTGTVSCSAAALVTGTSTFTLTANVGLSTSPGTVLTNTATVGATTADPGLGNNSASDSTTVTAAPDTADLSISKSNGLAEVSTGAAVTYEVAVSNAGPEAVTAAILHDPAVTGLVKTTVTCGALPSQCAAPPTVTELESGTFALPALAIGQSYVIRVTATVTAPGGTVTNGATVAAPVGITDPVPSNNAATDVDVVVPIPSSPQADLAIAKVRTQSLISGGVTTYEVTTVNNGPAPVVDGLVVDNAPTGLTFQSWTCTPLGTGSCNPASGVGDISSRVTLPPLESIRFVVQALVTAPPGTSITNQATIAVPPGMIDPNAANNAASESGTVVAPPASADLSVTKTNNVASLVVGTTTTYVIRATNQGPDTVTGALLSDPAAAGLAKTAVACSATPGACLTPPTIAELEGAVFALPTLASGAFYEIAVTASVTAAAGATVTNVATVAAPGGVVDSTAANNSAADADPVLPVPIPVADLAVTKTNGTTQVTAGQPSTYTMVIANSGPSAAPNVTLTDTLPAQLTFNSVTAPAGWNCTTPAVAATGTVSCSTPNMASGATATFVLSVTVTPATPGGSTISNTVNVASGASDPVLGNNQATDTDSVVAAPVTADLAIAKSNGGTQLVPGGSTNYALTVSNLGPGDVTGAIVTDIAPAGLAFASWTCTVANPGSGGSVTTACVTGSGVGNVNATVNLKAGAVVTFSISATVASNASASITNVATVDVPVGVTDPVLGNNTATDTDSIAVTPPRAVEVPTLSEWALLVLSLLLATVAMRHVRAGRR